MQGAARLVHSRLDPAFDRHTIAQRDRHQGGAIAVEHTGDLGAFVLEIEIAMPRGRALEATDLAAYPAESYRAFNGLA
jgi:hypothetical protein